MASMLNISNSLVPFALCTELVFDFNYEYIYMFSWVYGDQ
jgi:hypothetical protein